MKRLLAAYTKDMGPAAAEMAFAEYSSNWGTTPSPDHIKRAAVDIGTDYIFLVPIQAAIYLHAANARSEQLLGAFFCQICMFYLIATKTSFMILDRTSLKTLWWSSTGLRVLTPTGSLNPVYWLDQADPTMTGWEQIMLMICSTCLANPSPHQRLTGTDTETCRAISSHTGLTSPELGKCLRIEFFI